ncbi:MAG: hypothetical protein KC800_21055 [Candidatus Eremiobacteraeota bacterium]|nr:hypothetical protein [Candidatus Eremiobacteraeota bacterium]
MQKENTDTKVPVTHLEDFEYNGFPVHASYHQAPLDDLTSAGLLLEGLANPTPPVFRDPAQPTPSELRRRAIYENYRALADTSKDGGFGQYYGSVEPVSGLEVRGVLSDSATAIVQVPESFRPEQAKLLLVPASSSRGVYGGVLLGEWGLKRGYAVVLCDKGCGTGFHDLSENLAVRFDGTMAEAKDGADGFIFTVPDSAEAVKAFNDRHPHRYATKHAHSTLNVEAKWGDYVRESLEFAHQVLNRLWPDDYQRDSCRVIATGLSNGGGAALRAAEADGSGGIDGVVVGEPNVTPIYNPAFTIRQGTAEPLVEHSKPLLEYAALQNLFQLVASLAIKGETLPYSKEVSLRRLQGLQIRGLWKGLSSERAADLALRELYGAGILKEQNFLCTGHAAIGVYEGMSVALANCLGRYRVTDHLFGFSYAAIDEEMKTPSVLGPQQQTRLYALSNGLVPTAGIHVINDLSVGGPVQSIHSVSAGTSLADANLDGAVKLYVAAHGRNPITDEEPEEWLRQVHQRVSEGSRQCLATGNLQGRPAIIVNGRCDSIISPNHASRSYLGANLTVEKEKSRLSYIELEHAQHLDALNALPGFRERYVPLLPYVFQALTRMEEVLEGQEKLPPSQVVRTRTRVGGEALEDKHIPPVEQSPSESDRIVLRDGVLQIPE